VLLDSERRKTVEKKEESVLQKSRCWNRDQLHVCQAARMRVQQELRAIQAEVVTHSRQNERMKIETENCIRHLRRHSTGLCERKRH
jgi:hypothetical protein